MLDFSLLQKAGISLAEFAMLIRYKDTEGNVRSVTRAAVHRWVTGQANPSDDMSTRVSRILVLLDEAVTAGDLPLRLGTPRAQRKQLIVAAVGKHLQKVRS